METVMLLLVAGLALILSIAAFARHATASVDFEDMKSAFDKGKDDVNALAALGIFHSVNYGALNLTASPTAPPTPAPTEPAVTTSTQGDTHAA